MKNLPEHYTPIDIFISKEGDWHVAGLVKTPEQALRNIGVVFNALHGEFGEDGKVQQILDGIGIPYTGSGALASALGMNKILTKRVFKQHGIKTPYSMVVKKEQMNTDLTRDIFLSFPQPSVIKPAIGGSSLGVTIAHNLDDLTEALQNAFQYADTVLIEEYIRGKEATCGVIDHFREQERYVFMPTEIVDLTGNDIWDYNSKYTNDLHQMITPGNFSIGQKREMQELAKVVHQALDLRHYSRTDFIVHPKRGVYVLEVNTLPGLTETSLFPHGLEASGSSLPEFFDHTINLSLYGR